MSVGHLFITRLWLDDEWSVRKLLKRISILKPYWMNNGQVVRDYVLMYWKDSTSIRSDLLGPFDGKVAALKGDYLITTPNQDVIWFPPWGKRNVCLCANIWYGFDDLTLWPQPYMIEYPYLSAIPRKPDSEDDPLSIMWWNPTQSDFISTSNNLVNGLGSLAPGKFEKLCHCKNELMRRIDDYKTKTMSLNHVLLALAKAMLHACVWLSCLMTTFFEMKFGITEFQQYYLAYWTTWKYTNLALTAFKPTHNQLTIGWGFSCLFHESHKTFLMPVCLFGLWWKCRWS